MSIPDLKELISRVGHLRMQQRKSRGVKSRVWPMNLQKQCSDEPHIPSVALCASQILGRGDEVVTQFSDHLSESVDRNQGPRKEVEDILGSSDTGNTGTEQDLITSQSRSPNSCLQKLSSVTRLMHRLCLS